MATPAIHKGGGVPPSTNGKSDVTATRTDNTISLSLSDDGPTIVMKNGSRPPQREGIELCKITAHVDPTGAMVGWSIEKSGITAADDCSILVTASKTPKRTTKRATTGPAEGR